MGRAALVRHSLTAPRLIPAVHLVASMHPSPGSWSHMLPSVKRAGAYPGRNAALGAHSCTFHLLLTPLTLLARHGLSSGIGNRANLARPLKVSGSCWRRPSLACSTSSST